MDYKALNGLKDNLTSPELLAIIEKLEDLLYKNSSDEVLISS